MRAVIKSISSTDVDDLATWQPDTLAAVYFPLHITIGMAESAGGDDFHLLIATPEALRAVFQHTTDTKSTFLTHCLVVRRYVWEEVRLTIEETVATCTGETWGELTQCLCAFFDWEFENYIEFPEPPPGGYSYPSYDEDDGEECAWST